MKERASFASLTKYGLLLGIVLVIISLLKIWIAGSVPKAVSYLFSLLNIAAYIYFIYIAIKKAVTAIYFNRYKTGKGILVGLYVGLIAGFIMFFYTYLDILYIRPDYYDMIANQQFLMFEEIYGDNVEMYHGVVETMNHPMMIAFGTFFTTLIGSGVVSLFIAPFYKKMAAQIAVPAENQEESQEEN